MVQLLILQMRMKINVPIETFKLFATCRCANTASVRSGDSLDRPVWRSKTASHNGKICVNDGVIKRSLLRANVRGGRQCGDGAITRGNTNLTVYP